VARAQEHEALESLQVLHGGELPQVALNVGGKRSEVPQFEDLIFKLQEMIGFQAGVQAGL
jgi:hypothetical protein